jgi:Tol biopolymer transport system component
MQGFRSVHASPGAILRLALACLAGAEATRAQCTITRQSTYPGGAEIATLSVLSGLSQDGRYVAFWTSGGLLPQDGNSLPDIYVVDTLTSSYELLTTSLTGGAGNKATEQYANFSNDGRFIVFVSPATNLVPGTYVSNFRGFLRDRQLGTTQQVSLGSNGQDAGAWTPIQVSGNGRFVAFASSTPDLTPIPDPNFYTDVHVRDLVAGTTELVSISIGGTSGNYFSGTVFPTDITYDGRFVVYTSTASDLVPGDVNGFGDVFRRDRTLGITELISVSISGQLGNELSYNASCSEDGRYVVFESLASNLVPGDSNGVADVFLRDMVAGTLVRISLGLAGAEANGKSAWPAISPDGRFLTYTGYATNLVPGDTNNWEDIFLFDRFSGGTSRVSLTSWGTEPNGPSRLSLVSRDAGVLAFIAQDLLVMADTNQTWDVYARTCTLPASYCTAKVNSLGCVPAIRTTGVPLASWPQDFAIGCRQVLNQKTGMLFYSTSGSAAVPFLGGTLCLQQPVRRTSTQTSGGSNSGGDCSGSYAFDFNAWTATGVDPALTAGASVWAQFWSRDPGFPPPNNAGLSDATTFVIWP